MLLSLFRKPIWSPLSDSKQDPILIAQPGDFPEAAAKRTITAVAGLEITVVLNR